MKKNSLLLVMMVLLAGCESLMLGPDQENTAPANFDVLWNTLDEKYGLFPVTDVDWNSLYDLYRSQIDENTSDSELWDISCQLLSHLENGHVSMQSKGNIKIYCAETPDQEIHNSFKIDVVTSHYLSVHAVTGEGNITYGKIKDTPLGYICFHSFGGAANGRDWIRDLDDVIMDLQECEGIIIDVRNNQGGFARNDLYAGSFFVDRDITYYYTSLKIGPGHNEFGPSDPKIVSPRSDMQGYKKKNVVLTNRFTASGAEAFTLMCNNLSYSTQIGDTTIGALGDVSHIAQLPNGSILLYPCALVRLDDGSSPECVGIAPDIEVNNTSADITAGRDKVIECAIDYLLN